MSLRGISLDLLGLVGREAFLAEHTNVHMHFTSTYSSWLNQVELWFAKIERDVIARGVFTSVTDLKRKLMRYIRHYNKQPKPVKWKYFDPSRRITSNSNVTAPLVHLLPVADVDGPPVHSMIPLGQRMAAKTRAVLNHLVESLRADPAG